MNKVKMIFDKNQLLNINLSILFVFIFIHNGKRSIIVSDDTLDQELHE